jgi:hypothetical protein
MLSLQQISPTKDDDRKSTVAEKYVCDILGDQIAAYSLKSKDL